MSAAAPERERMYIVVAGIIVVFAAICFLGVVRAASIIPLKVPLDPNEGWNAYHAMRAMAGEALYPGPRSLMTNNYPPLSFYAVGGLGLVLGDLIVAGRLLSFASLLATVSAIFIGARRMGCGVFEALFSACIFLACLLVTTDYVGMDDPQLLGHAIAMGGVVLLLAPARSARRLVAAAFLFVTAGFVKHNLVVPPAAMFAWLLLVERRAALRFAAAGALFALAGLALFRFAFHLDFFAAVNTPRLYSWANLVHGVGDWLRWGLLPLGVLVALVARRAREPYVVLCALYALFGLLAGALFLGGDGVDTNAMFDADIALALGGGLALARLDGRRLAVGVTVLAAFLAPLAFALVEAAEPEWRDVAFWQSPMADERQMANADIALLRASRGPALCEMLSLCYWAGKPGDVDLFNLREKILAGAMNDGALLEMIARARFAAIQLESVSSLPTAALRHALAQRYRAVRNDDNGVFLMPR